MPTISEAAVTFEVIRNAAGLVIRWQAGKQGFDRTYHPDSLVSFSKGVINVTEPSDTVQTKPKRKKKAD
jgi:hypothetical protein